MILDQLSKQDSKWRQIAFQICKDKQLADDLVNDAYLRVINLTECDERLFKKTLKNLFIDYIRKQNKLVDTVRETTYEPNTYNISDYEQKVINRFYKLPILDQELIKGHADQSFRLLSENYGIDFQKIRRDIAKNIKKITDE